MRPKTANHTLTDTLLHELEQIITHNSLLTKPEELVAYSYDNSRRQVTPQAVVLPSSEAEIKEIILLCNKSNTPLTPRGRGTATTGAAVPTIGGIVLSTEQMREIKLVDPDNRIIITQPGATNLEIQQAAAAEGFFWAPDPSSSKFCSVGGNLACNSAGPRAVKYGSVRDNVFGLHAVTGAGEIIRTGCRTSKGVVGYDLTRLIIGSEGTLAVITEATLKLLPKPPAKRTIRATYEQVTAAAHAVAKIMAQPVTPCALEFLDNSSLELLKLRLDKSDFLDGAEAMLMVEVDGSEEYLDSSLQAVIQAASVAGLNSIDVATSEEEINQLWASRNALSPALRTIAPKKINEDVVVPVSHLPDLISGLEKLADLHKIKIASFGHAGNGNIHVNLLINPNDPVEQAAAQKALADLFSMTLTLGGTLSGEHGVGLDKRDFINREVDKETLEVMRRIKTQFDPLNIMNPDKSLPLS